MGPTTRRLSGMRVAQILFCDDAYQLAHARQVERYAELHGIQVTTWQGDLNPDLQDEQIRRAANEGFDAVMLQPVDPAAVGDAIAYALDEGVCVTAWAVRPTGGVSVPYLGLDEYPLTFSAGQHAATAVRELFPRQQPCALVVDIPSLPLCADYRMQGFVDGIREVDSRAAIHRIGVDAPEPDLVAGAVNEFLASETSFNIFTACNGPMLVGGLAALRSAGRTKAAAKRPASEYIFSLGIEGNPELVSADSSVMEVEALTPKENAVAYVDLVVKALQGSIDASHTETITGGVLLQPDSGITEFMREQYLQAVDDC